MNIFGSFPLQRLRYGESSTSSYGKISVQVQRDSSAFNDTSPKPETLSQFSIKQVQKP
jgi:hypothetical protein